MKLNCGTGCHNVTVPTSVFLSGMHVAIHQFHLFYYLICKIFDIVGGHFLPFLIRICSPTDLKSV